MEVKQFIENNLENMKADLGKLVAINSVYGEDEKPFGSANRKVLETALGLMKEKGLLEHNVDYYCGYGETGTGDKLIGILAHLDIVPAGDGWESDPFTLTEKDGFLFGRGVSDDKGAAVASMYALKYLIDEKYPFKKRVRLILGCNEETGSRCIAHYVEKCGQIDYGFTPDGDFPGIYAEKGMVSALIEARNSKIIEIYGGDVSNAVCKKCTAIVPQNSFDENRFASFMDEHQIRFDLNKNENIEITVHGKSAHASRPDEGINAFHYLMEGLYAAGFDDSFTNWFHKNFALSLHGELLGYETLKDDITDTSINLGVISTKDHVINVTLDMRFPVKTNSEKVTALLAVNDENNKIIIRNTIEPLFFDQNTPMIKALKKAYVDLTGDDQTQMAAIGGGTYAKAINNCIAWGCEFQGESNNIHDVNERLNIDSFKKQVELYVQAIKNLNEIED